MKYIADLHIHSHYSVATSKDCDPEHLHLWAAVKGLGLIGTGDFTHPAWREELKEKLVPAEEGLFSLRKELTPREADAYRSEPVRFVLSAEISSIYKKNGKTRKVHNIILLPGFKEADAVCRKLEAVGNIRSDGRPILGLDSKILLRMVLDVCPEAIFIPAHIWTPHFSVLGAFSGFERIEECFEELSSEIFALETGLSSDPSMNWRLSALDRFTLVSNSDAHSPANLAREANLFDCELSYRGLRNALRRPEEGFGGTIEFFPEEGKYHWDGHRNCGVRWHPGETLRTGGVCPVCGRPVTVGVLHRVEALADRAEGEKPETARPFQRLIPLATILEDVVGRGKRANALYLELTREFGSELAVLREVPPGEIGRKASPLIAEAVRRVREGEVWIEPGFDGEYGRVTVIREEDRRALLGQAALFETEGKLTVKERRPAGSEALSQKRMAKRETAAAEPVALVGRELLSAEQLAAITAPQGPVLVVAGPGSGKTMTLTYRIARLLSEGIEPETVTAVTFTRKAAGELRQRIARLLPGKDWRGLNVGTFHRIALDILTDSGRYEGWSIVSDAERAAVLNEIAGERRIAAGTLERSLSLWKNRDRATDDLDIAPEIVACFDVYQERLAKAKLWDLDDLLLCAADLAAEGLPPGVLKRFGHLLIDEFQDVNPVQYRLVRGLCGDGNNLFVIGDPDQSIYGFRGSDPQCFLRLREDFPRTATVELTGNYRANPGLVEAASAVIQNNPDRLAFRLVPRRNEPPVRLVYRLLPSEKAEALAVVELVSAMVGGADMLSAHGEGRRRHGRSGRYSFGEIGVLTRTGRQAEAIAQALEQEGLPYRITGAGGFLRAPEVQEFLSHLKRLAADPGGDAGSETDPGFLQAFAVQAANPSAEDLLAFWLERKKPAWTDNLRRLADLARAASTWPELLERVELGAEGDLERCPPEVRAAEAVSVMTIHAAKGLEFPVVILTGVEEGLIPLLPEESAGRIAEERRLFYVGLTRAKEQLIMTGARTRVRGKERIPTEPSRFLREIPPELIEEEKIRRRRMPGGQMALFE